MIGVLTGYIVFGITMICGSACSVEPEPASHIHEQALDQMQGSGLQGIILRGNSLQGMTITGFRFAGATLSGAALSNFRLENGELVAELNSVTLRGTALANAHLFAEAHNNNVTPHQSAVIQYRITAITAENPVYDPKNTGNTFLYTLDQIVSNAVTPTAACGVDHDNLRPAIPLADTWDDSGSRVASTSLFTFGCTTGAIAKCYRWGYRPWVTSYGDLKTMHEVCTRLARADYCGDGMSHTMDGTEINVWDNLPSPGPIQAHGTTPPGMSFEAGWNQNGAICLSHARWGINGTVVTAACPDKLRPPANANATVCDDVPAADAVGVSPMYNESAFNH